MLRLVQGQEEQIHTASVRMCVYSFLCTANVLVVSKYWFPIQYHIYMEQLTGSAEGVATISRRNMLISPAACYIVVVGLNQGENPKASTSTRQVPILGGGHSVIMGRFF